MGTCASSLNAGQEVTSKKQRGMRKPHRKRGEKKRPSAALGDNDEANGNVSNARLFFSWKAAPLLFDPASASFFNGKYGEEAVKEAARLREAAPIFEAANLPPHSVFLRLPGEVRGQRITVHENSYCAILLLDHCDSVSVHGCERCFIFIGPTSGSVFLERCRHCVIVCCCAQLRLRGCRHLQLSLSVATMPVLEESTGIGVCSLSGWFVYPLMPVHMQRAGLSTFNNFYSTVHDFTPRPVSKQAGPGCSPSGSNGNIYYIHHEEFEGTCWILWKRLGEHAKKEVMKTAVADSAPVAHEDVELIIVKKDEASTGVQCNAIQRIMHQSPILSCLPVLPHNTGHIQRNIGQKDPLSQLPVESNGLLEMFHHTVVVPFTFGTNRPLPQAVVLGKWEPRLFVGTTANGGATIALRIVREIELARRRAFIDRMQRGVVQEVVDESSRTDIDGDVLLLNTVELCCTEKLVKEQLEPVLEKVVNFSCNNALVVQKEAATAVQRMTRNSCIFLLALLRPASRTDGTIQGAQGIFSLAGALPPPPACTGKTGGSNSSRSDRSPSPRQPQSSESTEDATTWKKSVILNVPVPMELLSVLQNDIFLRAPMTDSGVGYAF
ncbi:hypothetical protein MOQ_005878 [Trypanosoma cruzi marinkellei]|uniref:C-CAP/cofactor C-like domain-containing protein n=1 Tax=Trypanosoma cruzi marinkellei TaxID=85056 RepID=K2NN72_TRYCR|nr:hypothetical protein MOQ_005878 [Trypanosoma cruzi marinkellei]